MKAKIINIRSHHDKQFIWVKFGNDNPKKYIFDGFEGLFEVDIKIPNFKVVPRLKVIGKKK